MKTIIVTDEIYNGLKEIAEAIKTQDNRATAKPYFFQVQTNEEIAVPSGCGTNCWYYDGSKIVTDEEINEAIFEWKDGSIPLDEIEFMDEYEKAEILEKAGWQKANFDYKHEYQNAFFTEKACKEHIHRNKHNLREPVDYLSHAFRNPEMEMMFSFFAQILNPPTE
jgi:hypothetical protein